MGRRRRYISLVDDRALREARAQQRAQLIQAVSAATPADNTPAAGAPARPRGPEGAPVNRSSTSGRLTMRRMPITTKSTGTTVVDHGKIAAIGGAEAAVPSGAKVVDVSGKHIYPGRIDACTTLGITEVGAVDVTFLGVADTVGSLKVGKEATLLITTGTPLDMTSDLVQSCIQGREINMMDIHKLFFQRYLEKIKQQTPKKRVS